MLYIKLDNDKNLSITEMDTIRRGDHLSEKVTFLIPANVGEMDILSSKVYMSSIRADGVADIEILSRSKEMYNASYYQFTAPITCKLTKCPGHACIWLNIMSGECCPAVTLKTGECTINIEDSKNMDDYLCDHQLTALYQMHKAIENGGDFGDTEWDDMDGNNTDNTENNNPDNPTNPPAEDPKEDGEIYWEDM